MGAIPTTVNALLSLLLSGSRMTIPLLTGRLSLGAVNYANQSCFLHSSRSTDGCAATWQIIFMPRRVSLLYAVLPALIDHMRSNTPAECTSCPVHPCF
ncbi:hypothetical protein DFH08DRAFT_162628 [Mycena albidolilacea]|uniref:Secreted protein n=1 Tax=Mycena albidolilacea TaxID=1033008 RepID=A0AAD7A2K1_9AGAR|nr:hypothetical protein DFH08DRAFT_162628 [Mycena albidolilacea]